MSDEVQAWFTGRIPDHWFVDAIELTDDRDEILVVGRLIAPDLEPGASDDARRAAETARIEGFRADTREQRIRIAREAEAKFGRKISWGARCGETGLLFTHLAIPAMTRLRIKERLVLDTLIDAGVARSRSEALAWCVRLVGRNQDEWLANLREALSSVKEIRDQGPA